MTRPMAAVTALALAAALLTVPAPAGAVAADQVSPRPDTPLGDYAEAPYRDLVTRVTDEFGNEWLELPAEYVFSPEHLERTVIINGEEWPGLVIVTRLVDVNPARTEDTLRYYLIDVFERGGWGYTRFAEAVYANWSEQVTADQKRAMLETLYDGMVWDTLDYLASVNFGYPSIEGVVSINGRPWQETEWRDYIIDQTDRILDSRSRLYANPIVRELFLDPSVNGHAMEAYEALRPAPIKLPENVTVADQVVLTVGSNQVIHYRGGTPEVVTLETPILAIDGVTMVPLRGILEALGATLTYWEDTVTITDGTHEVVMQPGDPTVFVSPLHRDPSEPMRTVVITAPRPAEIRDGRVLIPLRVAAEALGYQVTWDPVTSQITVSR
ncbi:copper amine oxidase N-terminal domain-containing protein [Symbiobacterium terraclitae]|uniref:copper amine oxidase N-terminal domain-containing protein n=1 Tax=Symbiobacterium terraclitae TaxID=557451 RepID=UPI0035B51B10